MKTFRFILFSLVVGIVSGSINHTAFAREDEVKLVVHDKQGAHHLSSDISGEFVIVGGPLLNKPRDDSTVIFKNDGKKWEKQVELFPKPGDPPETFGWSVGISGTTAIVGQPFASSVSIFAQGANNWKGRVKLSGEDTKAADSFGKAVYIDRNTAIVGSPKDDDAGSNSGSAYIFVKDEGIWKQQVKLVARDLAKGDAFGEAVVLRGGTIVVGAPAHAHSGKKSAGAAYVFVREGETWVQQAKLTADDAGQHDGFGTSVAIGGNTIFVGAPFHDAERKEDVGAAYIFVPNGATWKQHAKLSAMDAGKDHNFGSGVAVAGNIAIVGAAGANEAAPASGAAYGFARVDGVWEARKKVVPIEGGKYFRFGFAVAMSTNMVVVSSHGVEIDRGENKPHGDGALVYVYNSERDFGTPPFAVEPFGLRVTTLGKVKHTALLQNFPNPFNPETWLPYHLASEADVTFRIYNVQGQLTRELDLGTQKAAGYLSRETAAYWDGRDQVGETVSSGIYFYTLQAGPFQATRRMLILK